MCSSSSSSVRAACTMLLLSHELLFIVVVTHSELAFWLIDEVVVTVARRVLRHARTAPASAASGRYRRAVGPVMATVCCGANCPWSHSPRRRQLSWKRAVRFK
jgi:hypothetical protein